MRIAIVHSFYDDNQPSGENVAVGQQASLLRAAGHDVNLIDRHSTELQQEFGYRVRSATHVATGLGPSPLNEIRSFQPHVVHVHNLFPNWGSNWLRQWNGPIVTTLHNYRLVCAAATLLRNGDVCIDCIEHTSAEAVKHACYRDSRVATIPLALSTRRPASLHPLIRSSAKVVVLSTAAERNWAKFGLAPSKMSVVPNSVDHPPARSTETLRNNWVFVGRLSAEKGIARAVQFWPEGKVLDVYGDGPLRAEIERTAPKSVRVHGMIPPSSVGAVLDQARGLLFPSTWTEGSPLIYAEALARGLPVLALTGSAPADDIAAHNTGLVFESFDTMADKMVLIEDHFGYYSASAMRRFETAYSPAVWVENISSVYRQAMTETASHRHA